MADNLAKNPKKGILKNSSSFETKERQHELSKGAKFDEMNIIATLHPKDKDYGHMKIEEPKTPYSYEVGDPEENVDGVDAQLLADKMTTGGTSVPKVLEEQSDESSEDESLTEEERKRKKSFESKRKHHYNEFQAVKLARKLMEEEEDDDETSESSPADNGSASDAK